MKVFAKISRDPGCTNSFFFKDRMVCEYSAKFIAKALILSKIFRRAFLPIP